MRTAHVICVSAFLLLLHLSQFTTMASTETVFSGYQKLTGREHSIIPTMCTEQKRCFVNISELSISTLNYTDLELIGELAIGIFIGLTFGFIATKIAEKQCTNRY